MLGIANSKVIGGPGIWTPGATRIGPNFRNLTALIRKIFTGGVQGFAYDPNDLDATKLNWRRNLFTETEFRNGVNDITVKGGSFAATTFEGLTQGTGIRIDTNASGTYVYKTFTHQVGIPYVFSCYVRTLDGSVPVLGDQSTDASADFVLVGKGSAIYTPYKSITHLGNGLYRAVAVITNGSTTISFGVVKYAGNSTKPVIVSGYQLEVGSAVTPYQPFTDFNSEFIKAFPLHTLYQNTAGTVPVTAAGQPVGLMLDKSKGLSLSAELFTAALDFNNWSRTGAVTSVTANSFTTNGFGGCIKNPITTGMSLTKAYQVRIFGTCNVAHKIRSSSTYVGEVSVPAGAFDVTIKSPITFADSSMYFQLQAAGTITVNSISIKELAGNHAYQTVSASRPILQQTPILGDELTNVTSVAGLPSDGATYKTYSLGGAVVAGKRYKLRFRMSGYTGTGFIGFSVNDFAGASFGANGLYEFEATALQSRALVVFTGINATANFSDISVKEITGYRTDQNYLAFDGVDDFLVTNNIDFTMTNKVSLFAGVQKLSDATRSMVFELAPSTNIGTFRLEAPNTVSSGNILYSSGGSITGGGIAAIGGFNAPISIVATGKSNIAQDITDLRINGNLVATGKQDQGTGNYGNYPLYIGRRGGTSLPFNGHLYSLIGIGRLTTDSETIALEKAIAKNTGVTLNV